MQLSSPPTKNSLKTRVPSSPTMAFKKQQRFTHKCHLVVPLHTKPRRCVAGSFQAPWCSLGECGEQFCLVWESRFLRDLGSAMASLLDGLVSMVAQEALKYTVLSGSFQSLTILSSLFCFFGVVFILTWHHVDASFFFFTHSHRLRHRGGPDVARVAAGGGKRHRQPLVRLPEPLG